jgi:TorA maturation chaperone TorD
MESFFPFFSLAFDFLAYIFYQQPDREFLETLSNEKLLEFWPFEEEDRRIEEGLILMKDYVASLESGAMEEAQADFLQLFGGQGRLLAPPYASVYLEEEPGLFGQSTLKVRQLYSDFGLETGLKNFLPDDHLSLELSFLSYLCQKSYAHQQESHWAELVRMQQTAVDFLESHFLLWLGSFATLVRENARTSFYQGAALLTSGTVEAFWKLLDIAETQA